MAQVRSLFSKLEVLCRSLCPKPLVLPYKMRSPSQCFPVWECICLVFDFVGYILSDCTFGILFQLHQNSPLAFPGIKQNNSRFLSFVYSTTYLIFVRVFLALIIYQLIYQLAEYSRICKYYNYFSQSKQNKTLHFVHI